MNVDRSNYTRKEARRQIKWIGWACYYVGACDIYLDYQVWMTHFRWWHPLTWVLYVVVVMMHGIANAKEIKREMFAPKSDRQYTLKGASK